MNRQERIELLNKELKEIAELLKAIGIYEDIPPVLLQMIREKALHLADESVKLGEKDKPEVAIRSSYVSPKMEPITAVEIQPVAPVAEPIQENEAEPSEPQPISEVILEDKPSEEITKKVEPQVTRMAAPVMPVIAEAPAPKHTDIRKLMTLNDRFLFLRELYRGDIGMLNYTLDEINQMDTLEQAMAFIQKEFRWDFESPNVKVFTDMLERHFKDTLI